MVHFISNIAFELGREQSNLGSLEHQPLGHHITLAPREALQ